MRFAALQGGGASNYARAGKTVADEGARSFAITRKYGPEYGEIAKTGMKARSAEKRTAMEAGAHVTKAGIKAVTDVTKEQIHQQGKAEIRKIDAKMRKAGGIAAIGQVGAAAMLMKDNTKGRKRPSNTDAMRELFENYRTNRDAKIAAHEANRGTYDPDAFSDSSGSPSNQTGGSSGKSTGGVSPSEPSKYGNAYMSLLTGSGMSKEQAAALTGHLEVESDSFRADTEYAPNAYGTRGRGHLQWTDTGNSGGRRTNFESFAASKNLDPKSFEANSQFLLSEMQGNHGNHWTNGGSYQGFLGTKSVQEASAYLQNNYIRPGVPHTDRRLSAANNYYNNFNP